MLRRVKATCILHNLLQTTEGDGHPRVQRDQPNEPVEAGALQPLPRERVDPAREGLRVRGILISHSSREGAVPWQEQEAKCAQHKPMPF